MNFDTFAFHSSINANIEKLGYEAPTPIQEQAIPAVLAGRDVMGLAQTGTGKTAAFLLPIIDRFLKQPKARRGLIRALVVAPTRELAEQINDAARDYSRGTNFRSATVYGGVGLAPQTNRLRSGAELIVACPGRLLDHINQGHADLSGVEVLVLDEADHMFDMGFLPDIKKILSHLPRRRQTLLFSATMPGDIRNLAREVLTDPVTVSIGHCAPAQTVEQALYPVASGQKTPLLLELLDRHDDGSVLVFTRTKHRAKRLAEHLVKAGHTSAALQGNLSQRQRQAALDGFRDGRFRVLVATDIAARGIDVSRVAHVINFDVPDTPDAYTHRVGRTGRAERLGLAHTLVTREDASMIQAIERLMGKTLPRLTLDGFDYAAEAPHDPADDTRPQRPFDRNRQGQRPQRPGRSSGTPRTGSTARQAAPGDPNARRDSKPRGDSRPAADAGRPRSREQAPTGEPRRRVFPTFARDSRKPAEATR